MRRVLCLAATAMLAACGEGGSDDFSVDVAMEPARARTELAKLDGGDLLRALHLRPITAQRGSEGDLSFELPGDAEPGTLRLRFEETGARSSRVHVALDLPVLTRMIDGELMVLSETAVEETLQKDLEGWAKAVNSRGRGSLDEVNSTLGGVSIALQPEKFDQLQAAADDPSKLAGLVDPDFLVEDDSSDEYAESSHDGVESQAMGKPMVDTEAGLAAASAPMDDAKGTDPTPEDY